MQVRYVRRISQVYKISKTTQGEIILPMSFIGMATKVSIKYFLVHFFMNCQVRLHHVPLLLSLTKNQYVSKLSKLSQLSNLIKLTMLSKLSKLTKRCLIVKKG
jgi:hypothetical protein